MAVSPLLWNPIEQMHASTDALPSGQVLLAGHVSLQTAVPESVLYVPSKHKVQGPIRACSTGSAGLLTRNEGGASRLYVPTSQDSHTPSCLPNSAIQMQSTSCTLPQEDELPIGHGEHIPKPTSSCMCRLHTDGNYRRQMALLYLHCKDRLHGMHFPPEHQGLLDN